MAVGPGHLPDPPIAPKGRDIAIVLTILYTISLTLLGLRLFAKRYGGYSSLGLEDWTSIAAFICLTVYYGETMFIVIECYAGFHVSELYGWQVIKFLRYAYANNIIYAVTLPMVKFSILALYRRLFTISKTFNHALICVFVIVLGWMISVTIAQIFTCTPIEGAWNLAAADHCIDQKKFYYGNAVSNVITDVIILVMPLPMVWNLNMSTNKKVNVTALFILGGFVCIASILRIHTFSQLDWNDITFTLVNVAIWTAVETPLAYICASLPLLPLIVKIWVDRNKGPSSRKATAGSSYQDIERSAVPLNSVSYSKP